MDRFMEWLGGLLFSCWMVFGMKALGFKYALPYVPNRQTDEVVAVTFSIRLDYINKICQAIDGEWPEWAKQDREDGKP